jgi:acyl-CoA thioesterase
VPDAVLRAQLDAAIEILDDAQRQRLLDWAGTINRGVDNARAPGSSAGPIAEMLHITQDLGPHGGAVWRLEVTPELLNPHGVLHGGAVYTMVDYSMGSTTMGALSPGEICATIEIKISYLAGVRGGTLTCTTDIIKQGRKVVFLESKVTDDSGKLVAAATGSFSVIRVGESK